MEQHGSYGNDMLGNQVILTSWIQITGLDVKQSTDVKGLRHAKVIRRLSWGYNLVGDNYSWFWRHSIQQTVMSTALSLCLRLGFWNSCNSHWFGYVHIKLHEIAILSNRNFQGSISQICMHPSSTYDKTSSWKLWLTTTYSESKRNYMVYTKDSQQIPKAYISSWYSWPGSWKSPRTFPSSGYSFKIVGKHGLAIRKMATSYTFKNLIWTQSS